MTKEYTHKIQGDGRDSWVCTEKDESGNVLNKYMVYENPFTPNWRGLTEDLWRSPLFIQAIQTSNANGYSTLLKVLTDGEAGNSNEHNFLIAFNLMGMSLSQAEKDELNSILSQNNFTIQVT